MDKKITNHKTKFYNFKISKPLFWLSIIYLILLLIMLAFAFRFYIDLALRYLFEELWILIMPIFSIICSLNLPRQKGSHLSFNIFYYIWCFGCFLVSCIYFWTKPDDCITYYFIPSIIFTTILLIYFILINAMDATINFGILDRIKGVFNKQKNVKVNNKAKKEKVNITEKSGLASFLLCVFFGTLGFHRIFSKKFVTASLMFIFAVVSLVSLICLKSFNFGDSQWILLMLGGISSGINGLWILIDLIVICSGNWTIKG